MLSARLLLIDDHALFRTGLRLVLENNDKVADILEAGTVMDAIHQFGSTPVDIILLDIQLPGLNGLDGIAVLRRHFQSSRIIILSASPELASTTPDIAGVLTKSASVEQIDHALERCLRGEVLAETAPVKPAGRGSQLTPRQLEVLSELCLGRSNKAIANSLGLSENTVRVHVAAILEQFGVYSRTEAVLEAQRRGLVQVMR
ncbi:response regulator transcription factor [Aquitalea sp. LB_tupeE]|uniref:response regulator transcription factor n=1 Tax=Aquitalea sp. LB_tupeE TaxID=2748078 RepID=UPI0015BFA88D|nr:response regulator transcription factor [Aquitalea sp. LB_tupeE]NWK79920.1 response regulator transcription factor [Aquitalea sp. LB_tupeE]